MPTNSMLDILKQWISHYARVWEAMPDLNEADTTKVRVNEGMGEA